MGEIKFSGGNRNLMHVLESRKIIVQITKIIS